MATQNPQPDAISAAADELRQGMSGLTPEQQAEAKTMLGSIVVFAYKNEEKAQLRLCCSRSLLTTPRAIWP